VQRSNSGLPRLLSENEGDCPNRDGCRCQRHVDAEHDGGPHDVWYRHATRFGLGRPEERRARSGRCKSVSRRPVVDRPGTRASQFESPSTTKRHRSSGVVPVRELVGVNATGLPSSRARERRRAKASVRDPAEPLERLVHEAANASCGGSAPVETWTGDGTIRRPRSRARGTPPRRRRGRASAARASSSRRSGTRPAP
jgi:hypothetical protein